MLLVDIVMHSSIFSYKQELHSRRRPLRSRVIATMDGSSSPDASAWSLMARLRTFLFFVATMSGLELGV